MSRFAWVVAVVLAFGISLALTVPRREALRARGGHPFAYYRGLGIAKNNTLLGKQYTGTECEISSGEFAYASFTRIGYNHLEAYYKNGQLRISGEYLVEQSDPLNPPRIHVGYVKDATYFRPTGEVASEVKDGTGIAKIFDEKGCLTFWVEYKDYEELSVLLFSEKGLPLYYRNKINGRVIRYDPNGMTRSEGYYDESGSIEVGEWRYYDSNGQLIKVTQFIERTGTTKDAE